MLDKAVREFIWQAVGTLHGLHPDWTVQQLSRYIHSGGNVEISAAPFDTVRKVVQRCLARINATGSVKRKQGSGRPLSVSTEFNVQRVVNLVQDTKGQSTRSAAQEVGISQTSTWRILRRANLKPYHSRKTSRIRNHHLLERVQFARYMIRHFGHNPLLAGGERLLRLVNTDFSKRFCITPLPNTKNQVVWALSRLQADEAGGLVGVEKFSPGVMLWGGVSYLARNDSRKWTHLC